MEEIHKGSLRRVWKAKSENTHWLDASYYANVAANMRGIRLSSSAPPKASEHTTANTAAAAPESESDVPATATTAKTSKVATPAKQQRAPNVMDAGAGWFASARRR